MYVSRNLYDRSCTYVDMPDREFFAAALEEAKARCAELADAGLGRDYLKSHCPIVHVSTLKGRTSSEDAVDRVYVHDPARARRKFLMGDVDYEPGQEAEMARLARAVRRFARGHATPYMIYPTLSFPDKPRFRFVFLVSRGLDAGAHWKAMKLLYEDLGAEATDEGDLRMNTNRNLPLFDREEQLGFAYTNFGDPSLRPFSPSEVWGGRWKSCKPPKSATGAAFEPTDPDRHAVRLDRALALEAARRMRATPMARSYSTFWPVVASIAASSACGGVDDELACAILDELACAAGDPAREAEWRSGNRDLYRDAVRRIRTDEDLARIRPLAEWREFVCAARPPAPEAGGAS